MKNHITLIGACLTAIICTFLFSTAYKSRNTPHGTISVTGLGSKDFTSDLIVWNGSFARKAMDMKAASDALAADRSIVQNYFKSKGVSDNEIVFNAVQIDRDYNYPENGAPIFTGFRLSQRVKVESKEVDKVETLSREITELINQGIEFTSEAPAYFYTKLSELKLEMVAEATKDAKARAEAAAVNAGAGLGKLRNAEMGVFQITGQNSTEDYSWGGTFNTSSKNKTANITMTLRYAVY